MTRVERTACSRDCPDACGILASVEDGRVVGLRGERDHPVTRGFLCERTSQFLKRQYHPERLLRPLCRRGSELVEIGWEEALDRVAEGLRTIRDESGPEAILHYRSGGSLGILKVLNDYFFECLGGARVKHGDVCSGAGEAAQEADFGISECHAIEDLRNSRAIVLWGKNVYTSFLHLLPVLREARRQGARIVLIDPVPGRTAELADLTLRPRPGADRFLSLGVARVLFEQGLADPSLGEWSVGSEELRAIAFGRPVSAWARAADVGEAEVRELAETLGTRRPANIQVGWGLQRRLHGGVTVRLLDALGALSGNLGIPGGGVSFYYRRRGAFDTSAYRPPAERRGVLEPCLGQGIVDARDPPVRAVVVDNANPVAMLPDSGRVEEALRSRELVVVLDSFLTDTAACAHLVLPVTTMLEEEELLGAFGHHYLTATRAVVPPPEGVRSDLSIYSALASRLGFGDRFARDARGWAEELLAPLGPACRLDALRSGAVRNPRVGEVLFAGLRFATPDGRFHFVTHVDLEEAEAPPGYPLSLGSFSTPKSQSSQWIDSPAGEELEVRCHPRAVTGLRDGDPVRVVSPLGSLEATLRLDGSLRQDMAVVAKGGWHRRRRAANALIEARPTDLGGGAAYYDAWVRIESRQGLEP